MNFITKYSPYILLAIALISLALQYQANQNAKSGCDCQDKALDTGSGPIV